MFVRHLRFILADERAALLTDVRMHVQAVGMSEYVKDLSVILAVDWCAWLSVLG